MTFPNFDELSVGEIRDGQSNKSVLFDAQGMVHHLFEDGSRVVSGYYNGMCLLSNGMMATEDGTQLLVSWLPENEKIIRFAKDEEGVLLWSIKRRWNRWDKSYVYRKKNGWLNLFSMRYDTARVL